MTPNQQHFQFEIESWPLLEYRWPGKAQQNLRAEAPAEPPHFDRHAMRLFIDRSKLQCKNFFVFFQAMDKDHSMLQERNLRTESDSVFKLNFGIEIAASS